MGRYIYRTDGAGNSVYKYAFAEQASELGEVIEQLPNGCPPCVRDDGEIVVVVCEMLPALRKLLGELEGDSSPEARHRAAMVHAIVRDVEANGDGYFLSECC